MSNIIPPLISSSPPPLDMAMESDEEDEFQPPILDYFEFALPNDLPDMDIPEIDINRNKKEDKDFLDKRKSIESGDFNNSDVILPNILEVVPNKNENNDDLRNSDIFDSADIEILSVANKEEFIPKITEPETAIFADEAVNYVQNHVKSDRDINSPTEIALNTELNDKTVSDKELSSSEPNFESCSDNSHREHETNEGNPTNKTQDKSICDVDEIDDDFGDFADFNNGSTYNLTPSSSSFKEVNDSSIILPKINESNQILDHFIVQDDKTEPEIVKPNKSSETVAQITFNANYNENCPTEDTNLSEINLKLLIINNCDVKNENVALTGSSSLESATNENKPLSNIEDIPINKLETFAFDDVKVNTLCSAIEENPQKDLEDSEDEFGEFDSCTISAISPEIHVESTPLPDLRIDRNNVDTRSKQVLELMFPNDNHEEFDFMQDNNEADPVFGQIRNLTETNAITYQWNKSSTQKSLLKVLNVDIRNIMYGPGWNPSMPIFAANLSAAPLEPEKTSLPTIITPTSNNFNNVESSGVSEAQFDWTSSGLSNPLDTISQKDVNIKESSLGEPPKSFDTESVNSLQFTEVLTENIDEKSAQLTDLQEFDHFTNFPSKTEEQPSTSNTMFPLRETYIDSNERIQFNMDVLEDNEIVQNSNTHPANTIVSSLKNVSEQTSPDDDFTEFQASLPDITLVESKQSTNRSIEYKLAIENPIEPELLTNAKMQPAEEALKPTILQPLKIGNSSVNIAWPEPGITDDEVRKFEEYSYSKTEQISKPLEVTSRSVKPIDDEWSDFQDAAKELPLSIASLGKITKQYQWPNQNDIFPPAHSVQNTKGQSRFDQTVLKPTRNDDEWSDFVSHQPNSLRPVSTHLNARQEDWTIRGPQFNSWTSTSITPNILQSTSNSNALQFNGFNSFGRSGNILNSTVRSAGAVQGRHKGHVPGLGVSSKRESVPSISALPDLDFATSASRFSAGRLQQQKK